jgi:predicted RNA-binding protein with TRAM domain
MILWIEVSVPSIEGMQPIRPAAIVAAWFVLTVAGIMLERLNEWMKFQFVYLTNFDPLGWYEFPDGNTDEGSGPETYSVEDLKEWLDWERGRWRRNARQGFRTVVAMPLAEEMIVRGFPYLLSLTVDGYQVPLLLGGSLIWAYLHTMNPRASRQGMVPVFIWGLICVYLWAMGLWWLAVIVHSCHNMVAFAMNNGKEWWGQWRHSFTPGEEYTVEVDKRGPQPQFHGLYRAYTSEQEILYVADVEPGDTARVRVATIGGNSYAYPIEQTEENSVD